MGVCVEEWTCWGAGHQVVNQSSKRAKQQPMTFQHYRRRLNNNCCDYCQRANRNSSACQVWHSCLLLDYTIIKAEDALSWTTQDVWMFCGFVSFLFFFPITLLLPYQSILHGMLLQVAVQASGRRHKSACVARARRGKGVIAKPWWDGFVFIIHAARLPQFISACSNE